MLLVVLFIGLLAYASGAIFVRLAIQYDNADGLGFSLFLAASRMLLTALCCMPAWRGFRAKAYGKQGLTCSAVAGVCLALYFATWMTSLSFTSIAASTTLVNLNPIWVILLSWLWLCQRPTRGTLLGTGLAIMGAILISGGAAAVAGSEAMMALGNSLALAGSGAIATYILFGHLAQRAQIQLRHHMAIMYTTAAVVLLPMPLLFNVSYLGHTGPTYGCIFLMALITQLLGHSCINWSMKWVSPTLLSIFLLSEPLVASGLGYAAFGEMPTPNIFAGGGVVLMGVTIAILGKESIPWQRLSCGLQRLGRIGQGGCMQRRKQVGAIAKSPFHHSPKRLHQSVAYRSCPTYLADQDQLRDL
jgi:drug/metabolite transporter (DMT)-like permease